jgi:hypothetical protein
MMDSTIFLIIQHDFGAVKLYMSLGVSHLSNNRILKILVNEDVLVGFKKIKDLKF